MSKTSVGIIIPTWNNPQYLTPLLRSILDAKVSENLFHVYVINNGHKESCDGINHKDVTIVHTSDNLGWEGGLKLGLEYAKEPFVMFLNDDTHIPFSERLWLNRMLQHFADPKVAAVSPSSNVVMGNQNIFIPTPIPVFVAKFAIFFCVLLRRSAIFDAGGIDDSLPGGDDFDLSIRLRQKGYKIIIDKSVFVYHHGFKTGERMFGTSEKKGGWNSYEFKEKVDHALIKKHGFKVWWDTMKSAAEQPEIPELITEDIEGDIIRNMIARKDKIVLDVGCGGNKTLERACGIDLFKKDANIATLADQRSGADIQHDVSEELPFDDGYADVVIARHILEHLTDPITAIKSWGKVLKQGGKLIIAVPDSKLVNSIPMNVEHVHAWNKESMKVLLETCGFDVAKQVDSKNNISFITLGVKR